MNFTYDQIAPLILSEEVQGSRMKCVFGVGDVQLAAESGIKRDNSMQSQIQKNVTRTVTNRARFGVARMVRSALGGGMLGRVGSQVVNTAGRSLTQDFTRGFSNKEKQAAVVAAFEKVADHFTYEAGTGWQAKGSAAMAATTPQRSRPTSTTSPQLSAFEQLVAKNPITNAYDREVLGRMILEVANADGGVSNEEETFLAEMLPNYASYQSHPPLSPVECEEVSKNAKRTIYAIAWVLALVDLELSPLEEATLVEYGDWLGFNERTQQDITDMARAYLLEQHVSPDAPNEDAITTGRLLGMSNDNALRAFIQYKRRMG